MTWPLLYLGITEGTITRLDEDLVLSEAKIKKKKQNLICNHCPHIKLKYEEKLKAN